MIKQGRGWCGASGVWKPRSNIGMWHDMSAMFLAFQIDLDGSFMNNQVPGPSSWIDYQSVIADPMRRARYKCRRP